MSSPLSIVTRRLEISWLTTNDAAFILELVNDPDWIRYIGDKQVRCLQDAHAYLADGPLAMYRDFGFGLNRVALRGSEGAIGICGILRRDTLPGPDLGFALLPQFRRQGYAFEAADAVLRHAREQLGLESVYAILGRENLASRQLLTRLGFEFEKNPEPGTAPIDLYAVTL